MDENVREITYQALENDDRSVGSRVGDRLRVTRRDGSRGSPCAGKVALLVSVWEESGERGNQEGDGAQKAKFAKRTERKCSKVTRTPHCWALDVEPDREQEVDDAKWHGDDGCSEEERRTTQKLGGRARRHIHAEETRKV